MLKVALVDHHLNNFHADKFLSLLRGPLVVEGIEITSAWESHPTGEDWCAKNKVHRAASPADAIRDADAIMVLAPDNIESHLEMAKAVFPAGKPTLVDKFLAPNLKDAKEIVELARRHSTPIFSSSSLRYAVELEDGMKELSTTTVTEVFARGMGDWAGYGVHTLAMAQRIMGTRVKRVIDTGTRTARTVTLDYGQGMRAVVDVRTASNEWHEFGWSFAARIGDRYVSGVIKDFDGFYANLMRRASAFFKTGKSDLSADDMLPTVAVLESADRSLAAGGEWVPFGP